MKKKLTHEDAVWYIVHDTWELCNKPHRFFSSLRNIVMQFHDDNVDMDVSPMMNAMGLSGSKKETMKQIDRLEKMFQVGREEEHKSKPTPQP